MSAPNSLMRAILGRDVARVREVARDAPDLLHTRSPDGSYPVELARRVGRVDSEIALARAGAAGVQREPCELLLDYIGELSSDYFCAGWMSGIEIELWRVAVLQSPREDDILADLSEESCLDVRYISEKCGAWWGWPSGQTGPRLYPLSEWVARLRTVDK